MCRLLLEQKPDLHQVRVINVAAYISLARLYGERVPKRLGVYCVLQSFIVGNLIVPLRDYLVTGIDLLFLKDVKGKPSIIGKEELPKVFNGAL